MKTKTMLVALATLLIGSVCFLACQKELPLQEGPDAEISLLTDEYIVVFKDGVTDVPGLARQLVESHNGEISHIYQYAIKGFAATLSSEAVEALRSHPQIAWIEADQLAWPAGPEMTGTQSDVLEKTGSQTVDVPWGLDRIDQRELPLDNNYNYNQTGQRVRVYIIGEGVDPHDDEFGDRLEKGWAPRGGTTDHGNGSSTAMASIVGGTKYGVAKDVTIVPVRALVTPMASNIIRGLEWVVEDYTKMNEKPPAVALAGFFSRYSASLEEATINVIKAGITFVAPGIWEDYLDACDLSPARLPAVITVGSTNKNDEITSSPLANCINIFAPGTSIPSISGTFTGTGQAAAHVAGVAALYLEYNPNAKVGGQDMDNEVFEALIEVSTKGIVEGNPANNNFLYSLAWMPDHKPPVADFSYTTSELTVTFTDLSYGTDGTVVAWAWNFGDEGTSGVQHPDHTYAAAGTYTVTLTITDNEDATGSTSQRVTVPDENGGGVINLTVNLRKLRNNTFADLTWFPSTSQTVDIFRNGNKIATTSNIGSYADLLPGRGTYTYQVCEVETEKCSNEEKVRF